MLGIEFLYKRAVWAMILIALLGGPKEPGRGVWERLRGGMVRRTKGNLRRMKGGRNRGSKPVGVLEENSNEVPRADSTTER